MHRLVVIDDEYIVVEGIKAIIQREKLNCEVVGFAYDGIEALEVIRRERPDIVITDIRIPGLDGLSLIEEAKEFLPDTSFIVISGYTEFEYARRALTLGVKSYIDKPVTIEKVSEVISMIDTENERKEEKEKERDAARKYRTALEGRTELMICSILDEKAGEFADAVEENLRLIGSYASDIDVYKKEAYRMICVAVEVFVDQRSDRRIHVSYSEFEKCENEQQIAGYIRELVKQMTEVLESRKTASSHRIISRLLEYIDSHYNEDFGLNELAEQVNLNPAYLSILFKSEVGMSFVKYRTGMRIEKAKGYLLDGHKVAEVSEMVGYNNYRYFCDIFKKHVGVTPSEFKGMKK